MKLYPHQARFLDDNPRKAILAWEMRCGKSIPAAFWIDMPCRSGNTYIICIKQNTKQTSLHFIQIGKIWVLKQL